MLTLPDMVVSIADILSYTAFLEGAWVVSASHQLQYAVSDIALVHNLLLNVDQSVDVKYQLLEAEAAQSLV
jgi:hypothetical protein